MQRLDRLIYYLFILLFFVSPLILWTRTSELFEFNKMVFVYAVTTIIMALWIIRSQVEGKIIFRRTTLDIPLLLFIGSQLVSTVLSIDPRTSLLGYYSRFNGSLVSTLCYSLLYWAFVSNLNTKQAKKVLIAALASGLLVSIYGILQRLGIDKDIWVQDVVNRVFSTLGQPNWLAALLLCLIPLTWTNVVKKPYSIILSVIFFVTLIFTKSRSGLLGFALTSIIFWGYQLLKNKGAVIKDALIINGLYLLVILIVGNPFKAQVVTQVQVSEGPALEVGGTESGEIRKIVWQGAVAVWRRYPVFGSGPETFAYSYYLDRPTAHNLVSEWDFLYNKAHNEYLNTLANSGIVGLITYLLLIIMSIYQMTKSSNKLLGSALIAGYIGLLVSNFFGFSVVTSQLMLFILPATLAVKKDTEETHKKNDLSVVGLLPTLIVSFYLLYLTGKYWIADTNYALGKGHISLDNPFVANEYLLRANTLSPNEGVFVSELANSYAEMALKLHDEKGNTSEVSSLIDLSIDSSQRAVKLSPYNLNIIRSQASIYLKLAIIDPTYLTSAKDVLEQAVILAPTEAKVAYNLGLVYVRLGEVEKAKDTLVRVISLKPNYREARLAYGIILSDEGYSLEAVEQFEYILQLIDPNDSIAKEELERLK